MIPLRFSYSQSSVHFDHISEYLTKRIKDTIGLRGYRVGQEKTIKNCSYGLILYLKLLHTNLLKYSLKDLICLPPEKLDAFVTDLKIKHPNFF